MDNNTLNKIILINVFLFFFVWIIILLAGADMPPPPGFIWVILLVAFLDVAQFFYLKRFIPKLWKNSKWLFFTNLFYFFIGGFSVAVLTIITDPDLFFSIGILNTTIWATLIIMSALINAVVFYIFNIILIKILGKNMIHTKKFPKI
ncbi:hypothetical protein CON36_35375 [Bacillus cereus]|uniref:Uncharacterized protein n=2 Tax=Bacillus cereus group TaxID=86661 RepID=A0A9X6ZQ50_BACTU|nr:MULTISPECIES: hypothetical protein [Bacillus cereus group]PDZ94137.1 hypothetical protein CON36_35375 [Bacillus cereus]PFJ30553.1 hypothetical protein COJ15_30835 [Bacillus thuringiensis]PGP11972.1 hypothetical protein COA01_34700 [Bacillus cereus]